MSRLFCNTISSKLCLTVEFPDFPGSMATTVFRSTRVLVDGEVQYRPWCTSARLFTTNLSSPNGKRFKFSVSRNKPQRKKNGTGQLNLGGFFFGPGVNFFCSFSFFNSARLYIFNVRPFCHLFHNSRYVLYEYVNQCIYIVWVINRVCNVHDCGQFLMTLTVV